MPRSDAIDDSPDATLPDPTVIERDMLRSERAVSLTAALLSEATTVLPRTGAVALMTAVLEEAIRSCLSHTPQIRAEAQAWLTSGQRRSIFSFLDICETLRLDADATRRAIVRLVAGSSRKSMRRTRTNVRRSLLSSGRRKHSRAAQ